MTSIFTRMRDGKNNIRVRTVLTEVAAIAVGDEEATGHNNYFTDDEMGNDRLKTAVATFAVCALGDHVDVRLIHLGIVPHRLGFATTVLRNSVKRMAKDTCFVWSAQFWSGSLMTKERRETLRS